MKSQLILSVVQKHATDIIKLEVATHKIFNEKRTIINLFQCLKSGNFA